MINKEKMATDSTCDTPKTTIEGYVDAIRHHRVEGWVWDAHDPDRSIALELLEGDRLLVTGRADGFRQDLLDSGKGNGRHAFSLPVPPEICDNQPHQLTVHTVEEGYVLAGSPIAFCINSDYEGAVDGVDGAVLVGWVRNNAQTETSVPVVIYEDDRLLGSAITSLERGTGPHGFRFRLPGAVFDGLPHLFRVLVADAPFLVGVHAAILPALSTPWEVLREFSTQGLPSHLAPTAAWRYAALARRLEEMLDPLSEKTHAKAHKRTALRSLAQAHRILVDGSKNDGSEKPLLVFPEVAHPQVSVVMPVHNQFAVTLHALAALRLAPNQASFEVIVVDDGSDDETRQMSEIIAGIQVVRHETALGFVLSCNQGAQLARGDDVVLLNNDTEVTTGWLDELRFPFAHFDRVGLTGSQLLYPDGRLQEAGGIVWGNGDPWNYGRGQNPHDPRFNYTRQVDYLSGASMMLPRALWEELGGFSPDFAPAYFEDTDLAFRVREKGYKTVYAPLSRVFHFEGMSNGVEVNGEGVKRFQEVNRPKFKSRWVKAFRGNGKVGEDVERVKDRHIDFRALVIDAETPRPDVNAGSYAAIQEMRLLQSLGCKLTFVPENLAYLGHYTETLQRMGIECAYAPFDWSIHELIRRRGKEFDLVYITRYAVAQKVVKVLREAAPQAKILLCNADLHFLRELRAGIVNRSQELIDRAVRIRDEELAVMRSVNLVLSYNETEHAVIQSHNLDSTTVMLCPWVVEVVEPVAPFAERVDVAFLGGFNHWPNVEAVRFFVREVMPGLRQRLPGVRFLIYGSLAEERLADLETAEDVVIRGWVREVAEVYQTCRVFVSPLRSGAGIKGKVLGALAHGVPCVLSPVAAEGTGIRDGLEARIVDAPDAWVEAICSLYRDDAQWRALSAHGQALVRSQYSFEHGRRLMGNALESLGFYSGRREDYAVVR